MSDYYTNTSEYSPGTRRYPDHSVPMEPSMQPSMQPSMLPPLQPADMNQIRPFLSTYPTQAEYQNNRPYTYNPNVFNTNVADVLKRAIKYLFEGLAVAFVAYYFTKGKLDLKEVVMLGITAAFVFAILDTFSPTIAFGTRFGAGFGIGQAMFGLNPPLIAPMSMIM